MPYPGQTIPVRFHLERSSRPVRRSIIDLLIDSVTFSELLRRQPLVEARTLQDRSGRVCDILDVEVLPGYFSTQKAPSSALTMDRSVELRLIFWCGCRDSTPGSRLAPPFRWALRSRCHRPDSPHTCLNGQGWSGPQPHRTRIP